jgi:DNA primase
MPGIDFALLRQQISLPQVLDLVGFTPTTRRGPQWRGPCPVHKSASPRSRSFAAQVEKNCWHCFGCGAGGNALDLYLAVTKLPIHEGALELCARLRVPVPRCAPRTSRSPP